MKVGRDKRATRGGSSPSSRSTIIRTKERRMKKLLFLLLGSVAALVAYQSQTCNITILNGIVSGTCAAPPPPPVITPPVISAWADPKTVLVVVNDNTGPAPDGSTGTKSAGQFVADYYMGKRGIPAGNIVHTQTFIQDGQGQSCGPTGPPPHDPTTIMKCDPAHSDSTNIQMSLYKSLIEALVKAKITSLAAAGIKILYVVPTYGVPITVWTTTGQDRVSLDGLLALSMSALWNPLYNSDPGSSPDHLNVSPKGILIVSRLDGPDAKHSTALVDKAIIGETVGVYGIGYFDWKGLDNDIGDQSVSNAYQLCTTLAKSHPGQSCVENNQQQPPIGSGQMIQVAYKTAWAWGWYDVAAFNKDAYIFVDGAVGAQLTSLTANTVREYSSGAYVAEWLKNGITATWGAVNEPGLYGYALGDNLLSHLWRGYTFGESAYIASPDLTNMVFVGDPLYLPKVN